MKSFQSSDYIFPCLVINRVGVKLQGMPVHVIVANDMVGSVIYELKLLGDAPFSKIYQQPKSLASQVGGDISAQHVIGIQRHWVNPPAST